MNAATLNTPLFYVDVTQRQLSEEFKSSAAWDKEWKDIKGAPAEVDALVSSVANGGEAVRNAGQALINAANIPMGAAQMAAAVVYKAAAATLNTVSLAANATMSLSDGLFYGLDANFRAEVKSIKDPDVRKAAFIHYFTMKRAFRNYAQIFTKDDWHMLANGLERMASGTVLTAKEVASMSKNAADALIDLGAFALIGVGRPVGIVGLGITGAVFKAIARVCEVLKEVFAAGERASDFVGDKAFAGAGTLIDGYAPRA